MIDSVLSIRSVLRSTQNKLYPLQSCKLSHDIVRALGWSNSSANASFKTLQLRRSDDSESSLEAFYVIWLGEVSNHTQCVEVSSALLQDLDMESNIFVIIREVKDLPAAKDVMLEPLTKFDWDIASTQAGRIESTLLRDTQIISTDSVLVAHISSSLKAKFRVVSIKSAVNEEEVTVARMTNGASLVITPITENNQEGEGRDINDVKTIDASTLVSLVAKVSGHYPLKVLPWRHLSSNTNPFASLSSSSSNSIHAGLQHMSNDSNIGNLLDSLIAKEANVSRREAELAYAWSDKYIDPNDLNAVYIHPLVLKSCLEVISKKVVTAKELHQTMLDYHHSSWICELALHTPSGPSCQSLTRRLVLTDIIRPYYIGMAEAIRRSLGLTSDDQKVYLTILMRSRCVLPSGLKLCPMLQVNSTQTYDNEKKDSKKQSIIDALIRFIDQHSSAHNSFMLSDNQIITLDIPHEMSGLVEMTKESYLVQFNHNNSKINQPASSIVSGKYVLLDVLDQTDLLYDLLQMITVDFDHPVRPYESENKDRPYDEMKVCQLDDLLIPYDKTVRQILLSLFSSLSPTSLFNMLQTKSYPTNHLMLVGRQGVGKSTLLHSIAHYLQSLVHCQVPFQYVNCLELKELPIDKMLSTLSSSFQTAKDNAPHLLCLDNLDAITKSSRESGLIKDEKALLVSIHVARQMRELRDCNKTACASSLFVLNSLEAAENEEDRKFLMNATVLKALEKSVFLFASATSLDDMDAVLFGQDKIFNIISIPTLADGNRYSTLVSLLKTHHMCLERELPFRDKESIVRYTEGFVVGDMVRLCHKLRATAYNKAYYAMQDEALNRLGGDDSEEDSQAFVENHSSISYDDIWSALQSLPTSITSSNYTDHSNVLWENVGGYEKIKLLIIEMIRNPVLYKRLFAKIPIKLPKALLLYGLPGTGKTYLARAAGREFGMGFLCVRGPQLLDKYIGASEKAVRDLFLKAQEMNRPVLIFFDEFEALAPRRGKDNTGITDRIVNQLLTFIDGVDSVNQNKQIYLIAATCRPDLIDAALLRPGRIEKHVYVHLPTESDRAAILQCYLSKLYTCGNDNSLKELQQSIANVAKGTEGMSAADLRSIVNTAYLLAANELIASRENTVGAKVQVTAEHLRKAAEEAKPSLSAKDFMMYETSYKRFRGKDAVHEVSKLGNAASSEKSNAGDNIRHTKDRYNPGVDSILDQKLAYK